MPERIGKYEIRGELGRGGFGQVFLGFDPTVGRQVAIKVLSANGDASSLPRFRTEATAAGNLHHKNIVTIHEFGEDRGTFYIVMEYLEGRDLQHVINSANAISLLEKVRIMSQAAEGLHCAHQSGIVHRDVKPANIMVLDDGTVKVMDFGIARVTRDTSTRLTETGFLIGSVFYMAPEQLNGQEVDARCDIWAFGAIYYELLCGHHPFEAPEAASAMFRIMQRDPAPIQRVSPECPTALATVLNRLLAKDRDIRYQSFEDVLFDTAPILLNLESQQATRFAGQANDLMRSGRLDEALTMVKRLLSIDPAHAQGRALWQQLQGDLRQRSVRVRTRNLLEQSEKAAATHDFTSAIEAVESAIRMDPADTALVARLTDLRTAKQRSDLAGKLLVSARESLQGNNLSAAFRQLGDALNAEPGNAEAQLLIRDVQAKISARDTEKRIREGLAKVKGLLALQSFDEAVTLLEELAREAPSSEQVKVALGVAQRQRAEYNRQRRVQSELDAAKSEIKANQFEAAIVRLESLAKESSGQNDVAGLLSYARGELEAAQRLARIKTAGAVPWRLLKAKEFDRAMTEVDAALLTFPEDPTLLKLRQAIVTEQAKHQRAQFIQSALAESAEFERSGRLDQACAALETALQRYSDESSLVDALARARQTLTQQREQERVAAMERDLRQADTLIIQGHVVQASQLLSQIRRAYPGESRVTSLLSRVQEEEQRRLALDALRAELQSYLDAGQLDQACEAAARGRRDFGEDPQLIALGSAAEKLRARRNALAQARAAFHERNWRLAATTLEAFLKQDPNDTEARALLDHVLEQERAEQRRTRRDSGRAEAEKLIHALRFQEAVRCLRTLQDEFPDDDAIRDDLSRAVEAQDRQSRREAYNQGRSRADALLKTGQFQPAIKILEELLGLFPDDTILQQELNAASEAQREHARRERYAGGRRRVSEFTQARKFDEAISLLQTLLAEFPADPVLDEELKAAQGARELQERRERLNQEVAQLEKLYRKGDARAVKEKASALPTDLPDARVRELLEWATAELAHSAQDSQRLSADTLKLMRKRRIGMMVAIAAGLVLGAVLIAVVFHARPGSVSLSADRAELTFTLAPGETTSSQTLSIDGTEDVHWSAAPSDQWLSVQPNQGVTHTKLSVSVDARRLAPSNYSAYILFTSDDRAASVRTKVTVVIPPAATPPSETKAQPPIIPPSAPPTQAKGDLAGEKQKTKTSMPETHTPVTESTTAKQEAHTAAVVPPPPPITDCGPSYKLRKQGKLLWQTNGSLLDKGGTLVIGGPDQNLAGGRLSGELPGCEVILSHVTEGIEIQQGPSPADGYRRVKLHNLSAPPVSKIELTWNIK